MVSDVFYLSKGTCDASRCCGVHSCSGVQCICPVVCCTAAWLRDKLILQQRNCQLLTYRLINMHITNFPACKELNKIYCFFTQSLFTQLKMTEICRYPEHSTRHCKLIRPFINESTMFYNQLCFTICFTLANLVEASAY